MGGLRRTTKGFMELKWNRLKGSWAEQWLVGFRSSFWGETVRFKGSLSVGRFMVKGDFRVYGI